MPSKIAAKPKINYNLHSNYEPDLRFFPWNIPLEEWDVYGINFLNFRKGLSRHPVRFVKTKLTSYAIKQTTEEKAVQEINNFEELLKKANTYINSCRLC
jgi:hypothetical protein